MWVHTLPAQQATRPASWRRKWTPRINSPALLLHYRNRYKPIACSSIEWVVVAAKLHFLKDVHGHTGPEGIGVFGRGHTGRSECQFAEMYGRRCERRARRWRQCARAANMGNTANHVTEGHTKGAHFCGRAKISSLQIYIIAKQDDDTNRVISTGSVGVAQLRYLKPDPNNPTDPYKASASAC
ncbi:unnamed protein product [Sphagnum balticum]